MKIVDLNPHWTPAIREVALLLMEAFPQAYAPLSAAHDEVMESFAEDRFSRVALGDDEHVVGWIGAIREYDGEAWELHPLVVHPDHRGQGVGRALVQDIEQLVAARGAITLYLGSDDENDQTSLAGADLYPDVLSALARIHNLHGHPFGFYERLGFSIVGVIPDANGFGKPDILMAKRVGRRPQLTPDTTDLMERS